LLNRRRGEKVIFEEDVKLKEEIVAAYRFDNIG